MKTMLKRSMAILLILMMVISVLPMASAAVVNEALLPIRVGFAPTTSSTTTTTTATTGTITLYRKYSTTNLTSYTSQSTSTSTYLPWNPTSAFLAKNYKPGAYIPVAELRTELENAGVFDGTNGTVYTRSGTNNRYTLTASSDYTWDIYEANTDGVMLPDSTSQAYIKLTVRVIRNSDSHIMKTATVYIENPYVEKDYTLSYKITQTTTDEDEKVTTESGSFKSASADKPEVVFKPITGYYNKDSFELSGLGFGTSEYEMTYTIGTFKQLDATTDADEIKAVKKYTNAANADDIYKVTVTVKTNSTTAALKHHVDGKNNEAVISFYQPVIRPDVGVLKIGGITVLESVTGRDGIVRIQQANTEGTYDVTSTTAFTPEFTIPVINSTDLATEEYIIDKADVVGTDNSGETGTCSIIGYNPGAQTVKYWPRLNGSAQQKIQFTIRKANNPSAAAQTFTLTVKFASTAIATNYALNSETEYKVAINSGHELNLGSLITDFNKFSAAQKAQFSFTIASSSIHDGYGRYTVTKKNQDDTDAFESVMASANVSYTNKPGSATPNVYLDDYTIKYTPAAIHSSAPGYTIVLKNSADAANTYYTFKIVYNVGEAAAPSLKSNPSTISVKPDATSSTIKLANFINNFDATQKFTYKVTSSTSNYGTFLDASGSALSSTGYIDSATGFQYKGTKDSGTGTDTLKVEVFYNSTSLGTLTITAKCDPGVDCYTKSEFDSSYGDDNAFGVYLYNAKDRYYSFDRDDFVNSGVDFTDDEYEGTNDYIKITTLPIGGTVSGIDYNNEIDVADLDDLKYVRSGATDTGIDCFKFTLYNDGSRDGTYTMWIVGNESYLEAETGYTESQFKASYGDDDAFGKYAGSSGVTFAASDFTNGAVKLSNDYSDAYIEIVDEPIIGTLKKSSTTLNEEDRVAVADLGKLKYTWNDYDKENIDKFTFYIYKSNSGSTKSVSTKFTMWIVGNSALLSGDSENWSGTSTTMPIYKVTDVEVSDNIASVTLDEAWVTEALETVKSGSDVTIAVTPASDAKGLSLTVDKSLFTLTNASKIEYITLSEGTTGASISVSVSDILSAGGSGKDFNVTLNKLTISTANDIVANSLVASTATAARAVSFKAGGATISFNSVGAAILSVPYTNSSSYDDEMVVVFDYSSGNAPLVSSEFTGRYATANILKGGQYLVAVNSISFSDVSSNWAWTRGYIPSLAARGTISGMGGQNAGKYMPDGKLTRAEFVKLLVVSLGLEDNSATNPFSDMSDHWAKQVVAAAVKEGIVSSAATFSPDDPITRKDMALFAYRAAKAAGLTLSTSGSTTTFKDENEITGDHLTAVKAMQAAGIINGMGGQYEGYYLPNNGTDRASAAKIIWFLNAMLYGWNTSGKY